MADPGDGGGDHAAPLQVGEVLPQRTVTLDQATLIRYAGVSGDLNPLHWDPAFAATFSPTGGVIAHGMLTMGLLSALLTDWLGDAGRVRSMACQFRAACPVGATVTVGGEVTGVDESEDTATIAIWARLEDGAKVIDRRTSRAVVSR
jgi:acyl dehydratase